jgi:ATP-binding cassette subfamily C protein LapB
MFASRAVAPLSSVVQLATRYQSARAALQALDRVMRSRWSASPGKVYVPRRELSGRVGSTTWAFPTPPPAAWRGRAC